MGKHLLPLGGIQKQPIQPIPASDSSEAAFILKVSKAFPELFTQPRGNTAIELATVTILQELQSGKFLMAHRWDPTWMGGKATLLEAIPGLPAKPALDDIYTVIAKSVEIYHAYPHNDKTLYPKHGTRIPLGDWLCDSWRSTGCHSMLLRYLLNDPREADRSAWTALRDGIQPFPRAHIDGLIADYAERAREPLNDRQLTMVWTKVKALEAWYGENRARLEAISGPDDAFPRITTFSGLMGLLRDFYGDPVLPFWPDAMAAPGNKHWRTFVAWCDNTHQVVLNIDKRTPEEALALQETYNQGVYATRLRTTADRISQKVLFEFNYRMTPQEAREAAIEAVANEDAAAKARLNRTPRV